MGVEITGSYSLRLATEDQRLSTNVTAGGSSAFQVLVQNTGSADLTNVTLTGTPPTGWKVEFDTPTIATIAVGASATATATITPASGAIAGDYIVTLSAKAAEVSAPSTMAVRTTVETSSVWGFVGVGLIVLVLIGLSPGLPSVREALSVASTPVVIRTRGLEKRYQRADGGQDKVAVRSLDLDIRQGEVFGLLGPNGAGKTTTILMLLGLTEPTGGSAVVLGFDPLRDPLQVKRHVGYLPDNVGFYEAMTGRENLRYTARLNGIPDEESDGTIDGAAGRGWAWRRQARTPLRPTPGACASGSDWRMCWSRIPAVVILDEPTTSIDPVGVVEVLDLVRSLARDQGVSVLLSSHLLHQVQQVCDRIAIFVSGDVVATGTVAEIAASQQRGAQVTLDIGADGDVAAVGAVISAVPGVASAVIDAQDRRLWTVSALPESRPAILSALLAAGHTPWLVRDRGMELDEIYQRYFATTPAAAEETAA